MDIIRKIHFKVYGPKGHVIGYESWDRHFGWSHYILSEEDEQGDFPLHSGTIKDGIDRYERLQHINFNDVEGNPIFDRDILVSKSNNMYTVTWCTKRGTWKYVNSKGYSHWFMGADIISKMKIIGNDLEMNSLTII